jgi:large subunit ribosomal protein L9
VKIILLKDVDQLGRTGDVKEVSPGYARNYLLRQGMAVPATEGQMKQLQVLQNRRAKEDKRRLTEAQQLGERLSALDITVTARAGEQGRLFGSVTNQDVAAALKEEHGMEVDRRDIEVPEPIRTLGTHTVTVRLGGKVQAQLRVNVVEEGAAAAAATPGAK